MFESCRDAGSRTHWKEGRGRPNMEHMMALPAVAESLGLGHPFTDRSGASGR